MSCAQAEDVVIDFNYDGNHRVDFSSLKGSLQLAKFTDERDVENPNLITTVEFGSNTGGYYAEVPVAELAHTALRQGFESGGAQLTDDSADFTINGSILAIDATTVDRAGVETIQITFRTKLELHAQGRVAWQTTLFGRGRAPVEDGIVPAVKEALSRTVRELVRDDYFTLEIVK